MRDQLQLRMFCADSTEEPEPCPDRAEFVCSESICVRVPRAIPIVFVSTPLSACPCRAEPYDAFGRVMTRHFDKLGSSLQCIHRYPTVASHARRFRGCGWESVEGCTMGEFFAL